MLNHIVYTISALAGGALKRCTPNSESIGVCENLDDFWVKVLKWNFGSFREASGNGKTDKMKETL